MEKVKIQYVNETKEGTCIKYKEIDYESDQLNRIEKKLDSILEFLEGKELSRIT